MFSQNVNELARQTWLKKALATLPVGTRILDSGAGELKNRQYCGHLEYISQDFCMYQGTEGAAIVEGLQNKNWDTSRIDIVSDITNIPAPDASFDAILCSEVLEHVPEPTYALDEFERLLRPGGKLIITAPFCSLVHMAPYHFCTGFSKYWYEHHLTIRGFNILELVPNGDWFAMLKQEITRIGSMERQCGNRLWPLAYIVSIIVLLYFMTRGKKNQAADLGCFGYHCIAIKD